MVLQKNDDLNYKVIFLCFYVVLNVVGKDINLGFIYSFSIFQYLEKVNYSVKGDVMFVFIYKSIVM